MAVPPIAWLERFEARFPRAYRGLLTLAPLILAAIVIRLVAYPPDLQWPVSEFASARYEAAWILLYGACLSTPLWIAQRHPHGWWKALLPALLILGHCTLGLIGSYGAFHPADVGAVGSAVLLVACFGIFALASIPVTGLAALIMRR